MTPKEAADKYMREGHVTLAGYSKEEITILLEALREAFLAGWMMCEEEKK